MTAQKFIQPYKAILTPEQLVYFQKESKTHTDILAFIQRLNDSVVGIKLTAECAASEVRMHIGASYSSIALKR